MIADVQHLFIKNSLRNSLMSISLMLMSVIVMENCENSYAANTVSVIFRQ